MLHPPKYTNQSIRDSDIYLNIQCCLTLFDQVEQNYIPQFKKLSLRIQFEILVYGYQPYDHELTIINTKLSILTQNFILKTKQFAEQILP